MKYKLFRFFMFASLLTPDFKTKMQKLNRKMKTLKLQPLWMNKMLQSPYKEMYIKKCVNGAKHGKFLWSVRTRDHANSNTDLFYGN